jgi:hypothetical protein
MAHLRLRNNFQGDFKICVGLSSYPFGFRAGSLDVGDAPASMEIPYRDGKNHVGKGEGSSDLECLDSRWGIEKGDLDDGLGDSFPNRDFPLEGGGIQDKWCGGVLRECLR